MVQTTIASEQSDSAISTIFVSNPEAQTPAPITHDYEDIRNLGISNIIYLPQGAISPRSSAYSYIDETWLIDAFFSGDEERAGYDLIQDLLKGDTIVIEQSPPDLTSLANFLRNATGVAIGAYMGVDTATSIGIPLLMFVTVPFGMLIVGTAAGVGTALELGLRDKVLGFLKAKPGPAVSFDPGPVRPPRRPRPPRAGITDPEKPRAR